MRIEKERTKDADVFEFSAEAPSRQGPKIGGKNCSWNVFAFPRVLKKGLTWFYLTFYVLYAV